MNQTAEILTLPGFFLERTAKLLKLSFQRKLKEWNAQLTADQWVILHTLYTSGDLAQVKLAELTAKDAPTLTRMLDLLEEKAFISRGNDPQDARRWIIKLTSAGKTLVTSLLPRVIEFRQESYQGLSQSDLEQLRRNLNIISQNIEL